MPQLQGSTAAKKFEREGLAARCGLRYPPCIVPGEPLNRQRAILPPRGSIGSARAGIGADPVGARDAELVREASISHDHRGQGTFLLNPIFC